MLHAPHHPPHHHRLHCRRVLGFQRRQLLSRRRCARLQRFLVLALPPLPCALTPRRLSFLLNLMAFVPPAIPQKAGNGA